MIHANSSSSPALPAFVLILLLCGCVVPQHGAGPFLATDDASLISGFKELHAPIYGVYALGPDRDSIHDLLSGSFGGRALTREYVEHYSTIVRMQEEQTAIDIIKVDYEDVRIMERKPREARLDVDWSVGGVVTHRNHQHLRVNRYRAVYTVAQRGEGLRITDTRLRNSERLRGMRYSDSGWPLDEAPSSGLGFMDPRDLLRAGVETGDEPVNDPGDPPPPPGDTRE